MHSPSAPLGPGLAVSLLHCELPPPHSSRSFPCCLPSMPGIFQGKVSPVPGAFYIPCMSFCFGVGGVLKQEGCYELKINLSQKTQNHKKTVPLLIISIKIIALHIHQAGENQHITLDGGVLGAPSQESSSTLILWQCPGKLSADTPMPQAGFHFLGVLIASVVNLTNLGIFWEIGPWGGYLMFTEGG